MYTEIQSKYLSNIIPPNLEITDDCTGLWGAVLVFEHITQQFLHWSVSDGPVEEQQLYPLRIHKTQRGKKKKQLSEPKITQETKIKLTFVFSSFKQQGCDRKKKHHLTTL